MVFTYATLKAALISFTEDVGTEFDAALDTIIPLGEDRVLRDLDLTIFDVVETGTLQAASPLTVKPTGCLVTRDIIYTAVSGARVPLTQRDYSYAADYWPDASITTALPRYFAEYSPTQWFIAGTPSTGLAFSARFLKRPTGLSGANATSWMGTNVGDLLFHACMLSAMEFLKMDARLQVAGQEYADRLRAAKLEFSELIRNKYAPVRSTPTKVEGGK